MAALVAAALSIPVWMGRNAASDTAFFESATRAQSTAALEGYIKTGRRSVDAARAALPRLALNEAKRAGTVTALRAFLKTYAASPLAAEARTELRARYAGAIERYQRQAPPDGPGAKAITAAIHAAEATGVARIAIIDEGPSEEVFKTLDRVASPRSPIGYNVMLTAGFFSPAQMALTHRINSPMQRAFAAVFPPDVLTTYSSRGGRSEDHEPRLVVEYTVPPTTRLGTMDTRAFVLFSVRFRARMYVGSETVFDMPLTVDPPNSMMVQGSGRSILTSDVYGTIQRRAFDEMANTLIATIFDRSSQAYRQAMGSPANANAR